MPPPPFNGPGIPGQDAKPVEPLKPPGESGKITTFQETSTYLYAGLLGIAAAARGGESFAVRKFVEVLTGFKLAKTAGGDPIPTPFAVMNLLPQPLGMLPERFFMGKPRVPGTNVYVDPLHNVTRQLEKRRNDKRAIANENQQAALRQFLPTFTDADLNALLQNPDLKKEYITFVAPDLVDQIVIQELRRREADRDYAAAVERYQRVPTTPEEEARSFGFQSLQDFFAANQPDP